MKARRSDSLAVTQDDGAIHADMLYREKRSASAAPRRPNTPPPYSPKAKRRALDLITAPKG